MPRDVKSLRPNSKFFMLIGAVIFVVVAAILFFTLWDSKLNPGTGEMSFETEASGVIIRSEQLYEAENYGKANFVAAEGERVSAGETVAEVYKWGYTDNMATQLLTLQQTIMDYQKNNLIKDTLSSQLSAIDTDIQEKTEELTQVVRGETKGDVMALESELKALMKKRTDFLEKYVVSDDKLKSYYDQQTQLLAKIDNLQLVITAENDGAVSFYFDGAETILNKDKLSEITIDDINDIRNGKVYSSVASSDTKRPLYRLINTNEWYIMFISESEIDELLVGAEFTVSLKQSESNEFKALVFDIRQEDGKYIYTLLVTDDIGDLLTVRSVDIRISKNYSGITVPTKALSKKDGQQGVYIMSGSEKLFVPVTVKIIRDGQAMVEPKDSTVLITQDTVVLY